MKKLAEFGIHGAVNASLQAAITRKLAEALRKEMGGRGLTSLEASLLKDAKDRYKRAKAISYENVEDRYHSDETFCDRAHEDDRGLADCICDSWPLRTCQDPPRTRIQISAGVAANAEHEHLLQSSSTCLSLLDSTAFLLRTGQRGRRCGASCLGSMCSLRQSTSSMSNRIALIGSC